MLRFPLGLELLSTWKIISYRLAVFDWLALAHQVPLNHSKACTINGRNHL